MKKIYVKPVVNHYEVKVNQMLMASKVEVSSETYTEGAGFTDLARKNSIWDEDDEE